MKRTSLLANENEGKEVEKKTAGSANDDNNNNADILRIYIYLEYIEYI